MSRRGWIEALPRALEVVSRVVRSGVLGTNLQFLALRSVAAGQGTGVLDEFADDSLRTLSTIFDDFDTIGCAHDGRGAPEAEAHLSLANSNAVGTLVLSRLRSFRDRLEIAGEAGLISLDRRTGKVTANPPGVLETVAATPPRSPTLGVYTWNRDFRANAQELRHPWELAAARAFPRLAGKRVLVTGATGFIGARLVERLAENGARITAGLRDVSKAARIARLGVDLAPMRADTDLAQLVRGHEAVVNLAHDFHASPERNEALSVVMADACEAAGVKLLVQASSIAVYDQWPGAALDEGSPCEAPGHSYKELKRAIERDLAAREAAGRLRSVVLQPTIVYGAFSSLWTDRFVDHFRIGDVAVPDEGLCEGVHVDDLVDAILAALAEPDASGRYIVSGPAPFAWLDMLGVYSRACREWGELRLDAVPSPATAPSAAARRSPPGAVANLRARLTGLAASFARRRLGEARLVRLKALILKAKARGGQPLYRPAAENPRLFANRAAVSTARMRRDLAEPVIGGEQGADLVRAYLRWRFCPFEDWPGQDG